MARKKQPAADPAEAKALRDAGLSAIRAKRLALLRAIARSRGVEAARVTFPEYMAARPRTDDPRGDFTADFSFEYPRNPKRPEIRSLDDLTGYLTARRARTEAVAAGASCWREYESVIRDALERDAAREMASRAAIED